MSKALEIVEQYIPCTCGEMYLSRNMSSPDCPLHAFDWESTAKEIAELAFDAGNNWAAKQEMNFPENAVPKEQFITDLFKD